MDPKQEARTTCGFQAQIQATGRLNDPLTVKAEGSLISPRAHTKARKAIEMVLGAAGPGVVPVIDLAGLEHADRMGIATIALTIVLHLHQGGHVRLLVSPNEISEGLLKFLPSKHEVTTSGAQGCSSITF